MLAQSEISFSNLRSCALPVEQGDITFCDFSGADFGDESLAFRDLYGANLENADLSNANLTMVRSGAITGTPAALPFGWVLKSGYLVGLAADLTDANLANSDLSGLNLSSAKLVRANLNSANLEGASLEGADMSGAVLNYAKLNNTNIDAANFTNSTVSFAKISNLEGIPYRIPLGYKYKFKTFLGPNVDYFLTNFSGEDRTISGESLRSSNFSSAKLFATSTVSELYKCGTRWCSRNVEKYGSPLDVSASDLSYSTFTSSTFRANTFRNSDLSHSDLSSVTGTNLLFENVDLSGSNLQLSSFTSSQFTSVNLSSANLTDVVFNNSILDGMDFTKAQISGVNFGRSTLQEADFSGLDLRTVIFGCADLSRAKFVGSNLSGLDLSCVNLSNADLTGASIQGTNFKGEGAAGDTWQTNVTGMKSSGLLGIPATFPDFWVVKRGYFLGPTANLVAANLSALNLNSTNLEEANLENANLANASLAGANLTNARIRGANITNTFFSSVTKLTGLSSGDLVGEPIGLPLGWRKLGGYLIESSKGFAGLDMAGTDFSNQDLTNVNLSNADLTSANLESANLTGANLAGANLFGVRLEGANLNFVSLSGVSSGSVIGEPLNLPTPWKMIGGFLVGPQANLAGADLSGLDLATADLSSTDLTNAILSGVKSGGIIGLPILSSPWKLERGYLVGPKADLSGALFQGGSLRWVNLKGANLAGSTFSEIELDSISLDGAIVEGATLAEVTIAGSIEARDLVGEPALLPLRWKIESGSLLCPKSVLINSDFEGRNLSNLDLRGSNFESSNLTAVNFSDSDLSEVNFSEADLSNAHLNRTTLTDAILNSATAIGADFSQSSATSLVVDNLSLGREGLFAAEHCSWSDVAFVSTEKSLNCEQLNLGLSIRVDWFVDGILKKSGSSTTYTPAPSDLNKELSVNLVVLLGGNWILETGFYCDVERGVLAEPALKVTGELRVGSVVAVEIQSPIHGAEYIYRWFRQGTEVDFAQFSDYLIQPEDFGQELSVEVTVLKDWFENASTVKSVGTPKLGQIMEYTVPILSDGTKVGTSVRVNLGDWLEGTEFSYQWYRGTLAVPGATQPNYLLRASDFGAMIRVEVTGSLSGYESRTVSSASAKVLPATITAKSPTISGVLKVGSTLSVKTTPWVAGAKVTYQWLLDGKAIKGATKNTYKILPTQKKKKISVLVTQSATGYITSSKTSGMVKVQ